MSGSSPITCEEALRQLAAYLDRELAGEEHRALEHHLGVCRSCFSRAEFERRLKSEIAGLASDEVPPSLELRVRALINSFPAAP